MNLSWNRSHDLRTDLISEDLPVLTFNVPNRPLIPHETDLKTDSLKWFHNIYWSYDAPKEAYLATGFLERAREIASVAIHFFSRTRWGRFFHVVR